MTRTSIDPRILRGTQRMLAALQDELAEGAEQLGWKVGFGAPGAMASLGIDRPLVGFLTTRRRLEPDATAAVRDWTRGLIEAEIAAHVGHDLGPAPSRDEALAAVAEWSLAIELVDLDRPPDDVEAILGGNIFHRYVLLGDRLPDLPDPLRITVHRDGAEVVTTDRPDELTGDLGSVLASAAATLADAGSALRAGDVVITGSVVTPIPVSAGESWLVSASGLGEIGVRLVS